MDGTVLQILEHLVLVTEYTAKMLEMVVWKAAGDSDSPRIVMPVAPPSLCHEANRPEMSHAVANYVSRFKKK